MKVILLIAAISGVAYFIFRSKKADSNNSGNSGSGYGDYDQGNDEDNQDEYGYDNTNR